jgi:hypothetical protein
MNLYLDMDGVIADFDTAWAEMDTLLPDTKRFRAAVLEFKIFEKLNLMDDAHILLNAVRKIPDLNVEMLSSAGSHRPDQYSEAARQKKLWLEQNNIGWTANFTRNMSEKCEFATPDSILIDDRLEVITDWEESGGIGIHHTSATESVDKLMKILVDNNHIM